ncbi:hypothetical protein FD977_10075 [Polynucleobacter sp. AP-Elch-400A-B2]|uniref:hypothetical protein n=1 Tax=Polynucleobacter sp. AP-Elch-400A-B2 TaxID=2576930 RepID=UPI001BFE9D53|nr:hypothetical protein [Polynucleobacter sp. AP-Elch-400A-B2]QWE24579.1 hypothetical protein FD977_10075 [Polynucleobacter sp. AP-Elch-400A-B2]
MLQKFCVVLALAFLLSACSPKLDWRTVQSPQEAYTALFPGKPEKIERKLPYQNQEIPQTLEAVKIDDDIYSVSAIRLSKNQVSLAPNLLEQMQGNLFSRANVNQGSAINVDALYRTANKQRAATKDYFLEFQSSGRVEQSMRVRWITRMTADNGVWIYQVSVLHTAPARVNAKTFFSEEAYLNFFDEFHPE